MNIYYCFELFAQLPNELQNHIITFLPEHPILTHIYGNLKCIICSSNKTNNKNPPPTSDFHDDYYCQHNYCDYCLTKNYIITRKKTCNYCKGNIGYICNKMDERLAYYGEPW